MKKNKEKDIEKNTEKKPFYKKWWFFVIIGIVLLSIVAGGSADDNTDVIENSESTSLVNATEDVLSESETIEETAAAETELTQENIAEEKLIIEIEGDSDGAYSTLLVFNEGTEDEMSRYVQIIPPGTYKATNIDYEHFRGGLNIYSEELHTGSTGFDEFAESYLNESMEPGESVVVTIEEGQCIYIPSPGKYLFEQQ